MYFVVYDSISVFGESDHQNVSAFESLEQAQDYAKAKSEEGSPRVRIAQELNEPLTS